MRSEQLLLGSTSPKIEYYFIPIVIITMNVYLRKKVDFVCVHAQINATKHEGWTYADVADKAVAVHAALTSLGLGGGDTLCVMLSPRLEILPLFVGAACANVAFVYEEPGYPVGK